MRARFDGSALSSGCSCRREHVSRAWHHPLNDPHSNDSRSAGRLDCCGGSHLGPARRPGVGHEGEPPQMTAQIENWRPRYRLVAAAWERVMAEQRVLDLTLVEEWSSTIDALRSQQRALKERGAWRAGPRTLLAALDVQYRELAMTAGFAWLLRPDGHHGLGSTVLAGLLDHLGVHPLVGLGRVRVVLEEQRADGGGDSITEPGGGGPLDVSDVTGSELALVRDTRADLVVYGDDWTVVVEAKTFALEQDQQLDRLHRLWQDERSPSFVFLTRGRREATTAVVSHGQWQGLTWLQIARIVRAATADRTHVAPGVYDYIETLEAYHHA